MNHDDMDIDEILRRYLPRAPEDEMEAAGERVLARLHQIAAKMTAAPEPEPTRPEALRRIDHLVLTAVYLLRNAGDAIGITGKVNELSDKRIYYGTVFGTLDRLQRRGLVESWFGPPLPEYDGEGEQYFKVTTAGETALAEAPVQGEPLTDSAEDFA